MSGPDRRLPLDFQLETQGGGSWRRVTHLVHDPALPPSAPPRLETWEKSRVIGEGGQGTVLLQKCTSRGPRENTERALKVIRCAGPEGDKARYISELGTMARFSHERYSKFFVKMLGWYFSKGRRDLCIALDYLPLGDLQTFVETHGPLAEQDAQQIIGQVLHGLGIMHEAGFAHRDVKPQNILIQQYPSSDSASSNGASSWWIKLADFGISKSVDATITAVSIGSHTYMAPELFCPPTEYHKIDFRLADVWSVGATAFFLLTKQIYRKEKDSSTSELLGTRGARDFPSALRFVLTATIPDPSHRLSWTEASSHSWVASYKSAFSVRPSEEAEQDDDDYSTSSGSSGSTVDEPSGQRGLTTVESHLTEMSLTGIPAAGPLDTVVTPINARDTAGFNQEDNQRRIDGEVSNREMSEEDGLVLAGAKKRTTGGAKRATSGRGVAKELELMELMATHGRPKKLVLRGDAKMLEMSDAGRCHFLPIPVTDGLVACLAPRVEVYLTGVTLETTVLHSKAIDFFALCAVTPTSTEGVVPQGVVFSPETLSGYFATDGKEVNNSKSPKESLLQEGTVKVAEIRTDVFTGYSRDSSLFSAPIRQDVLVNGDWRREGKAKEKHQGRVQLPLTKRANLGTAEDRFVRENIRVYWSIQKMVPLTLNSDRGTVVGPRYTILCGMRSQVDTSVLQVEGGKQLASGMLKDTQVSYYVRFA